MNCTKGSGNCTGSLEVVLEVLKVVLEVLKVVLKALKVSNFYKKQKQQVSIIGIYRHLWEYIGIYRNP